MTEDPTTLVWFRRDLRVDDHPALASAARRGRVACLFVLDPDLLGRRHHQAPARLRFLRAGLEALDAELGRRGVRLVVRAGAPAEVVPAVAAEAGADRVHVTRELGPVAAARDARVARALEAAGAALVTHGGDLVVEPEAVPGPAGAGYLVFTAFHRVWRGLPVPERVPAPDRLEGPRLGSAGLAALPGGDAPIEAGPEAARARLVAFIRSGAADAYPARRDLLADDATSHLSAHLRFGMCSPAQIGRALGLPGALTPGRDAYWRQIAWREFYRHHLHRHPVVVREALRPELRAVRWDDDPRLLAAWARGETGVPLVDAGMRQLVATGWMHNRARMVTASYLVKDLLVDWRKGETVFMQELVDGDPANNNGGWQWTAGTGTDAAPYFRVFNPTTQARRFDPDATYIRRWVPELRDVPARRVHEPWTMTAEEQRAAACRIGADYPAPLVDHGLRRREAIARYQAALARTAA